MKKILASALILSLILVMLSGCGQSNTSKENTEVVSSPAAESTGAAEPVEAEESAEATDDIPYWTLTYHSHSTEGGTAAANEQWWLDRVTEATDGHVTFETYFSGTLMTENDAFTGIRDGIADCGYVSSSTINTIAPGFSLLTMMFTNLGNENSIYENVVVPYMEQYPQVAEEMNGVVIGGMQVSSLTGVVNSTEKAGLIVTPDDMKGKLAFAPTDVITNYFIDMGAAPVSIDFTEWYSSFERGIAEVMWMGWGPMVDMSLGEVLPYHSVLGMPTDTTFALLMFNEEVWNEFPAEYQQAILGLIPEYQAYSSEATIESEAEIRQVLEENGGTIYYMNDEETQLWADAASSVIEAQLEIVQSENPDLPVNEMYDYICQLGEDNT